ncbi:response regulator transcription factor [Bacteroidota bacterium]
MYKILIVEDEPAMQSGLKDNLEFEGYTVDIASDGSEGYEKITSGDYNLVLLDVMLPKMSGFDVCKAARKEGVETPIILLTAKGEEIDKVLGLELGADDYITKPFSLRELLARVKAVLRRSPDSSKIEKEEIHLGKLKINFTSYNAFDGGEEIKMSHKEYEIIKYLWDHQNETVSRDDLMNKVWGYDYDITTRTVDNFMLKLRQKIEQNPNDPKIILTVHGIGYKLIV